MTPKKPRSMPKRQPSAWERRWIRWAKQEMQRSEKQLIREKADTSSGAPRHLPLEGKAK